MTHKVLVVDDNEDLFKSLRINFSESGYDAFWAENGQAALRDAASGDIEIVLLDLSLGAENGLDVLVSIQKIRPGLPVIIITGYGTFETAVKAVKMGAFDFIPKPLDFDKLFVVVENAISLSSSDNSFQGESDGDFITRSPKMHTLLKRAKRLAAEDIPVLITGESGTGKELLAQYIHRHSARRTGPFVQINCSVLTNSLIIAELFGHEKGAFTGADQRRIGLFEQADGGTLHLDEIGDMDITHQAKILRVIEDFKLRRIGGMQDIPVNVRILASTNKNMEDLLETGAFRQDLLFRLNAVLLYLPPLRERGDDLKLLAEFFLREFSRGGVVKHFSPQAWVAMDRYSWPGNVRELRNMVKVCSVMTDSDVIEIDDLPQTLQHSNSGSGRLNDAEKEVIVRTLSETRGNKSVAAVRLGITRRTLYKKMERYGIS